MYCQHVCLQTKIIRIEKKVEYQMKSQSGVVVVFSVEVERSSTGDVGDSAIEDVLDFEKVDI